MPPLRQRRGQQHSNEQQQQGGSSNSDHNSGSGNISGNSNMSFEQLKREAAALERQLEDKLSRYQQVRS